MKLPCQVQLRIMPCIEIYTNLPNGRIPEKFHSDVTDFFCGLLGKEPRVSSL